MFSTIVSLISVGILWGATNPFIRVGSQGIEKIASKSTTKKFFLELKFLITKPSYLIPFVLNQCGSVLYILTLQNTNLSTVVPIANSLTFLFSAISGYYLGENIPTKSVIIGSVLVSIGSGLMIFDKITND